MSSTSRNVEDPRLPSPTTPSHLQGCVFAIDGVIRDSTVREEPRSIDGDRNQDVRSGVAWMLCACECEESAAFSPSSRRTARTTARTLPSASRCCPREQVVQRLLPMYANDYTGECGRRSYGPLRVRPSRKISHRVQLPSGAVASTVISTTMKTARARGGR